MYILLFIFLFYLPFFKRQGPRREIPFLPSPAPSSSDPTPFFCFSAPSYPAHSFMAEHNSLTSPNKKHTLQLNRRGHPHPHVTGQARSLTFFRGSLLLTGWDVTLFLFIEKKLPQMLTTPLFSPFFSSFAAKHTYLSIIHLASYLPLGWQKIDLYFYQMYIKLKKRTNKNINCDLGHRYSFLKFECIILKAPWHLQYITKSVLRCSLCVSGLPSYCHCGQF